MTRPVRIVVLLLALAVERTGACAADALIEASGIKGGRRSRLRPRSAPGGIA